MSPTRDSAWNLQPKKEKLWWAYAIAPSVAPTLFAITILVAGFFFFDPKDAGTPIGLILIPTLSMTAGMVLSYLVAGLLGMPIAFFLKRKNILNGLTIHAAALAWSIVMVFAVVVLAMNNPANKPLHTTDFLGAVGLGIVFIAPFVLLSATTFWWIISKDKTRFSIKTLLLLMTVAALAMSCLALFLRPS